MKGIPKLISTSENNMVKPKYDTLTNPEQVLHCESSEILSLSNTDEETISLKLPDIEFSKGEAINPQLTLCKTPDDIKTDTHDFDPLEDNFYDKLVGSPLNFAIHLDDNYVTTTSIQGFGELPKDGGQFKFSNPFQEEDNEIDHFNSEIDFQHSPIPVEQYFGELFYNNNNNNSTINTSNNNKEIEYQSPRLQTRLNKRKLEEDYLEINNNNIDKSPSRRKSTMTGNNAPKVIKKNKRKSDTQPYNAFYWSKRNRDSKVSFEEEAAPDMIVAFNPSENSLRRTSSKLSNMLLKDFDFLESYANDNIQDSPKKDSISGCSTSENSMSSVPTIRSYSTVSARGKGGEVNDEIPSLSNSYSTLPSMDSIYSISSANRRRKLGDEIHWKPSPAWALWELHKIFHLEQKVASKILSNESSCFGLLNMRELGAWERGDSQHTIKRKR